MKTQILILLAGASLCFGCAKKSGNNNAVATTGTYTYEYPDSVQGCTTQIQRPQTLNDYCENLRDDARNNNCAVDSRYEAFRTHCPDHTWNHGPGRRGNHPPRRR